MPSDCTKKNLVLTAWTDKAFFNKNDNISMNRLLIFFLTLSLMIISCKSGEQMGKIDTTTVKQVDINRYVGRWYEIARFPHSFEKDLVGVTATYTLRKDGKIDVLNQGYVGTLDGRLKQAMGKAKIPNSEETGRLKVSFFLFFYADYFILELDEADYQYAMIGSSSDKYLWILCRQPEMPAKTYQMLVSKAQSRGYNTDKLIVVKQLAEQ